jgi:thioester reductase-like protein
MFHSTKQIQPIAIIGIGCRFPGGANDPGTFWKLLSDGVDAIREVPEDRWLLKAFYHPDPARPGKIYSRWGGFLDQIDRFDPHFFGIAPREAAVMDPQQRLLLETAWEALEDAGQVPERLAGSPTGVFIGIASRDFGDLQSRPSERTKNPYLSLGSAASIAANRISYFLDLRGPSFAVDTACSSSLVAVHLACQSLWRKESSVALVGGVNVLLVPETTMSFCNASMMSPDGRCKAFDARANGYVRAEGAGVVLLKPLEQAERDGDRIYAVILGSAVNQDGRTNGITVPSREAQEAVQREVCRLAGVQPQHVQYVEAHGTGTPVGDPIEANALGAVFGAGRAPENPCLIGSVKTNIGHLEAGAGVAGLIKTALALWHREIPAHLHFQSPNPQMDLARLGLRVPQHREPWPEGRGGRRLAGINSFGFGGANAHVLLAEAPSTRETIAAEKPRKALLVPLSARSPEALQALARSYREWLRKEDESDPPALGEIAFNAAIRRSHHLHRLVVVAQAREKLAESLEAFLRSEVRPGLTVGRAAPGGTAPIVFVFTGMGPQWWGMGRQLLREEPVFRAAVEECDGLLQFHGGWSLLKELAADDSTSRIHEAWLAQPAIFALQVGLAALWASWGVRPDAVVGHSVGEVAAAYVAGALSLPDAVAVIFHRSRLQHQTHGLGRMMATGLSLEQASHMLNSHHTEVGIAAMNSPRSVTLSGDSRTLEQLHAELNGRGIFGRFLQVDVPYHSPAMNRVADELRLSLAGITPRGPQVPLFSTVTAQAVEGPILDACYWCRNVREPVKFAETIDNLLTAGHDFFLEVGPHPVLAGSIKECAAEAGKIVTVAASLRREEPERATLLAALGQLYTLGRPVNWNGLHPAGGRVRSLPTYPWQRERCWQESEESRQIRLGLSDGGSNGLLGPQVHPLLGRPMQTALEDRGWHNHIDLQQDHGWLGDHRVRGEAVYPGAAYLEMARAAAEAEPGGESSVLEGVEFHKPLILDPARPRPVQLVVQGGQGVFSIYAQETDGSWTLHASGILQRSRGGGIAAPRPVTEILSRCSQETNPADWYPRLRDLGLEYGPAFQNVEQLRCGEGEALGKIRIPGSLLADSTAWRMHPAVLDACFQVLFGAVSVCQASGLYLPRRVDRLRVHSRLEPGHGALWSHVRRIKQNDAALKVSIDVFDDTGRVLIEIDGMHCQLVPGTRHLAPQLEDHLYEDRWQVHERPSAPASDDGAVAGNWLILCDQGGVGKALATQLRERGGRAILLSHGDRYALQSAEMFTVRPGEAEDLRQVIADAFGDERACRGIVHLWSLDVPVGEVTADELERSELLGCGSAVALVQTCTEAVWHEPPRLWLMTRSSQAVGSPASLAVAQAPLWGLARVVMNEHPELHCTLVDLGTPEGAIETEALLEEVLSADRETEVALRGPTRYVNRLTNVSLRQIAADDGVNRPATSFSRQAEPPFRLDLKTPGLLDSLTLRAMRRTAPNAEQVEIEVHAAGLNFKDVAKALNLLRDASLQGTWSGKKLGLECAGRIAAIGAGVTGFEVGDEVLAFAPECFASHVRTDARSVMRKPEALTFEEAATLAVVFLTSYHALYHLARLQAGERVLIHAGAGGVGQAAIQLAQRAGAEVFTTAGSPQKRDFLRSLGARHVMDSRSLDFADEVREKTRGEGVDVVLNSLMGEAASRSLSILRPGGRFLELGKRDIEQNHRLPLAAFQNNISYHAIDLDRLWVTHPHVMAEQLREIMRLVAEKALRPLPSRVFPITQAADAFMHMARSRHIGKVVLSFRVPGAVIEPSAEEAVTFRPDGAYLLVGGLGGFGFATAAWMVERGARHLVLMGRRTANSPEVESQLDSLRQTGAEVRTVSADVTQHDQVSRVLEQIRTSMPPLRGVVHSAMVLDDGLLGQLSQKRLRRVLAPKVQGAWNLHQLTRDDPLDFFVLFSSAVATLGNAGQANYAAANAFLNALAHHRRAQGLPALTVDWTALADVGHLAQHTEIARHLANVGLEPQPSRDLLRVLGELLQADAIQTAVMRVDWQRVAEHLPGGAGSPRLHDLIGQAQPQDGPESQAEGIRQSLLAAAPPERVSLLETWLREQLGKVLGASPSKIEVDQPLAGLGLDSLMAVELGMRMRKELEIDLPIMKLLGSLTVGGLVADLVNHLAPSPAAVSQSRPASPERNGKAFPARLPAIDWSVETALPPDFGPGPELKPMAAKPSTAFLTGATGFLGSFLLDELLRRTDERIFCLVRAGSEQEARERIHRSLSSYRLGDRRYEARIIPLVGDLAEPNLGLAADAWRMLEESVDVIYHNGARLNLLEPYPALRSSNVLGTRSILQLARAGRLKPVHFVSSLGVFDLPPGPVPIEIGEEAVPSDIASLRFGYTQSKAVAEHLVRAAGARGIPVSIYRPGLITACSRSGACTTNDFIAQLLKSWVRSGLAPVIEQELLLTPVDFVSRAIVFLAGQTDCAGKTFHLVNPAPVTSDELDDMIRAAGYPLEVRSYCQWWARLTELVQEESSDWSAILPLLRMQGDSSTGESLPLWPPRNMRFRAEQTTAVLARHSLLCPPIDARLIKKCLEYFRRLGFLPALESAQRQSEHLAGSL